LQNIAHLTFTTIGLKNNGNSVYARTLYLFIMKDALLNIL